MRFGLISALLLALPALPAMAERLPLSALSAYVNGLETARAQFTQIGEDGSLATGTLYIKRPGRMRFEYDPPNGALVVAGASRVVIFDPKSNTPPESYPLRQTPLWLLLEPVVDLTRSDMVVGHAYDGTATVVTAQDPERPGAGRIQLTFTADPVALRKWVVTDETGARTTVIFQTLETGMSLGNALFDTGAVGAAPER